MLVAREFFAFLCGVAIGVGLSWLCFSRTACLSLVRPRRTVSGRSCAPAREKWRCCPVAHAVVWGCLFVHRTTPRPLPSPARPQPLPPQCCTARPLAHASSVLAAKVLPQKSCRCTLAAKISPQLTLPIPFFPPACRGAHVPVRTNSQVLDPQEDSGERLLLVLLRRGELAESLRRGGARRRLIRGAPDAGPSEQRQREPEQQPLPELPQLGGGY